MASWDATRITVTSTTGSLATVAPHVGLFALDGSPLGEAEVVAAAPDGRMLLGELAEPDRLLGYYFARSGRRLLLDLGEQQVDGWLETRWDSDGRRWWVDLDGEVTS